MTTHWTAWNGAANEAARIGSATFATLVPSDDSTIDSDKPAKAQRYDTSVSFDCKIRYGRSMALFRPVESCNISNE